MAAVLMRYLSFSNKALDATISLRRRSNSRLGVLFQIALLATTVFGGCESQDPEHTLRAQIVSVQSTQGATVILLTSQEGVTETFRVPDEVVKSV